MAERIRDINPAAQVFTHPIFYNRETADAIDLCVFDYIADAIDSVDAKVELIIRARQGKRDMAGRVSPRPPQESGIPIISCMGAGNKLDPTRFEVAPLSKTSVCPLCKTMRRRLKEHGIDDLDVVFSRETPQHHHPPGSVSFVPSVAGLIVAGEIVKKLSITSVGQPL
jgi:tRNA A37 threonylcarbamoyladenosine dehydratase